MSHVRFPPCCRLLVATRITRTILQWWSSQRCFHTALHMPAVDEALLAGSGRWASLSESLWKQNLYKRRP